jgi:hypothetical protein
MKKLTIIMVMSFFVAAGMAQSKAEQRKAAREAKQEQKAKEEAAMASVIKEAVENQQFVLEADFLSNKYGERVVVPPNLNFVGIDKEFSAFQFANGQDVGYNGVGGVTVEGSVQNYNYRVTKKGVYTIEFSVATSAGTIFVNMVVSPNGMADATVSSNRPGKLNYQGRCVPLSASTVYKGSRTF